MKNKFSAIIIICVVVTIAVISCKKPISKLALYIPKDATVVFVVDAKAVTNKIASSGISLDSLVNVFTNEKSENVLPSNDIKNSGIDLNKSFYIFLKQTNSIQQGKIKSGALIAEVQDVEKLETFFKKTKTNARISSANNYKYVALGDGYIAGWKDKVLIISLVTIGNDAPGTFSTGEGTLSQQQLTTLFAQKESASITSLDAFNNVLSKPGDVHFYTNASAGLNTAAIPGMTKANELLQGSYTQGIINFEKGKIVASSETHYNNTLSNILNKYPAQEVNINLIKSYPDSLTAFAVLSFNTKILLDILHYLNFDSIADSFAASLGFTTSDVTNALSGDFAIMFSPRSKNNISPRNPGFLLNLVIGDKPSFDKVLNGLLDKQILSKKGDQYQLGITGGHGFVIETANNSLYISSSDELIKTYQSSSKNFALPAGIEKQAANKSMVFYVDINALLQNKSVNDSSADIQFNDSRYINAVAKAARETFKNVIAMSDKGSTKVIKASVELNFVNANENSLAGFTKFMAVVHREKMNRTNNWTAYPPLSGLNDSLIATAK